MERFPSDAGGVEFGCDASSEETVSGSISESEADASGSGTVDLGTVEK